MSETEQAATPEQRAKSAAARIREQPPVEDPSDSELRSEADVHAALAAWAGTVVGGVTPEEAKERGYEPPPESPGGSERSEKPKPNRRGRGRPDRREEPAGPQQEGRVRWFDLEKGYGFIRPDDGEEDVFVHLNQFRERPEQVRTGTRVSYHVGQGRKGKREAKHVDVR